LLCRWSIAEWCHASHPLLEKNDLLALWSPFALRLHGDSFRVYGDEYHSGTSAEGKIGSSTTFQQVWWYRLVL
jgi:hypothetical protein